MNSSEQNILSRIRSTIKKIDSEAEIILYGSRARGTAHSESDWDILVLLNTENVTRKQKQVFRHALVELEIETGEAFSTFAFSKKQWENQFSITPFYQSVMAEGIVV